MKEVITRQKAAAACGSKMTVVRANVSNHLMDTIRIAMNMNKWINVEWSVHSVQSSCHILMVLCFWRRLEKTRQIAAHL